ncbi:hypothetical protein J4E86_010607 [Alternaria arbusti]|uniref:uncharacterized protein n=1 Tax=Alternaria arbusti TaxID=232088 RepID=UPI00221EF032|nr:uncharacterized protein J4E86_010607 [Alternaria arbusti]KAI4941106.1 hypothetical protein J4E86_010607 [Alternaria arbusti]
MGGHHLTIGLIKLKIDNLAEIPTKQYSPAVVKIVASSIIGIKYSLADEDVPSGTTATAMHLQLYLCATEMGMECLEKFAFKFFRNALTKDGSTPEGLRSLVEHHKLFTVDFCQKAFTLPQYEKVMCTFATHIIVYEDVFDGSSFYSGLPVVTAGYLLRYLHKVKTNVKLRLEAHKKGLVGVNKAHRRRASRELHGRGPSSRRLIDDVTLTPSHIPSAASAFEQLDGRRLLEQSVDGSSLTPRAGRYQHQNRLLPSGDSRFRELDEEDDEAFNPPFASLSPIRPVKGGTDREIEHDEVLIEDGTDADMTFVTASQGVISSDNGGQPQPPPPPQAGGNVAAEPKDTTMHDPPQSAKKDTTKVDPSQSAKDITMLEAPESEKKDTTMVDPPKSAKKDTTMINNTTMGIGSPGPGS